MADDQGPQDEVQPTLTDDQPTPPPTDDEGKGEAEEVEETSEDKSPDQEDWETKYKESSREAHKLVEEKKSLEEQMEQVQQNTLAFALADRGRFEQYLDHSQVGPDRKEKLLNWYDTSYSPQQQGEKPQQPPPEEPQASDTQRPAGWQPDPVMQDMLSEQRSEYQKKLEEQTRAWREFESDDTNKNLPDTTKSAIAAVAYDLDTKAGYSPAEAIAEARKRVLDLESVKGEGYAQGLNDGLRGVDSRGVDSASTKPEGGQKLPAKHEGFIQMEINRKGWKPGSKEAREFRQRYVDRYNRKQE
jgi:hypothetical protein